VYNGTAQDCPTKTLTIPGQKMKIAVLFSDSKDSARVRVPGPNFELEGTLD
jgi:hypothetical protein